MAGTPPVFRGFNDITAQRNAIYDGVLGAVQSKFPIQNATHRLEVEGLRYDDFNPSKADEKKAILGDGRLQRALRGTVKLVDANTNQVVESQEAVLAHVPHLTDRGTFILNGTSWLVRNQARLRPGIYTRKQKNGGTEAHFNVKPGTGRGFRIEVEPETGVFKLNVGQSTTRLYPLLRSLGVDDATIKEAWGDELYAKNFRQANKNDLNDVKKLVAKFGGDRVQVPDDLATKTLAELLSKSEIDEDTAEITMGRRFKNLSPADLVEVTKKILKVGRGEAREDNRDSQSFQSIHSAEDFFAERIKRDPERTLNRLLWKAGKDGLKKALQPGALTKLLHSVFNGTGLAATPEESNQLEVMDLRHAITRMGEGGISDPQAVSREARGIQPSYLGLIDFSRAPESGKIGLDLRVAHNVLKGSDNQMYAQVRDARTGKMTAIPSRVLEGKAIAFPGELSEPGKRVRALKDGEIKYVRREDIDYELPHGADMMSPLTMMVPFPQSMKGQRLAMATRMTAQALPLKDAEAPFVQGALPDGTSTHDAFAGSVGVTRAETPGRVIKVTPDEVTVLTEEGRKTYSLYNNFPGARMTMLHNTPTVQVGDIVQPGQLLAKSNLSDANGKVAVGKNLRVGWMVAKGSTHEDGIVISESAAKKLTSEQAYQLELPKDGVKTTKKADYVAIYGPKFTKQQYSKLQDDGVIAPGTIVQQGDPIMLAVGTKDGRALGAVMKSDRSSVTDKAVIWDHEEPGEVVDIKNTRSGTVVFVKSYTPSKAGDKLSMRWGNKGVITDIRPDNQMPHDEQGRPLDVLLNASGVISRINPGVLAEALLGKVVERTGKPYVVPPFEHDDVAEFALSEAAKHGVKELETVTDPTDNRKIDGIFTGVGYFMKLHHLAEKKLSARDTASYDAFEAPARGGFEGSKRISMADINALVAHGATEFLKDAKLVRGQRNDDYWRAIRSGEDPTLPNKTFANDHFKNMLKAAGVNIREQGTKSLLRPMLDKDVTDLAEHEITSGDTFDFDTMKPVEGGLFDLTKTGGADGTRWAYIKLPKKIPHPLFFEPIARVLGVTLKKLEGVMAGNEELYGKKGPEAVEAALQGLDVDKQIDHYKSVVRTSSGSKRDDAVRALGFLAGFKKMDLKPADLMISKIPVIPPKYRPISRTPSNDVIHDLNYLYQDLLDAKSNVEKADTDFGDSGQQYVTMYKAAKAVVGTGKPVDPKREEQQLKGLLGFAIGVGDTPKAAVYQRRVLGSPLDAVGRSVVTLDPSLKMDEIGLPEDMAWNTFKPYIIRRLVKNGVPATEAVMAVRDRTKQAKDALLKEMDERPVVYNRAPVLHRYSYVGGYAKLIKGNAIAANNAVMTGLNLDFDGDAMNIHVPTSPKAVEDVKTKLLPSKNLKSAGTFDVQYDPKQDYVAGLFMATNPANKPPSVFMSATDAIKAYTQGKIKAGDPVRILDPKK